MLIESLSMKEPFSYRARKWLFQQVSSNRHATQHRRLETADWDVLIILDACSARVLRSVANWPVESVVSPASCTPEWLEKAEKTSILDGRIVSANPQYEKFEIDVEPYYNTHWNERLSTVLPEPVLSRAHELLNEGEQVVAHLQQPHWPYVAKLDDSWKLAYSDLGPWKAEKGEIKSTQVAMARGCIDVEKARQAYRASVRSVWSEVVKYVDKWADRSLTTVITADHGEAFGGYRDFGLYEHPCQCHIPSLTTVPWVKIDSERPNETSEGTVTDRLEALGYAD